VLEDVAEDADDVVEAAPLDELELLEELLPHPASASTAAATAKTGSRRRISPGTVPGDNLRKR
jgi:hypothetical protein